MAGKLFWIRGLPARDGLLVHFPAALRACVGSSSFAVAIQVMARAEETRSIAELIKIAKIKLE
jgi:hypothetical protein